MSEVEIKIDAEIGEICEMMDCLYDEMSNSIQDSDLITSERIADMIKDLAEAKEHIVEAMYKRQIMIAMEHSEYGKDYDEYGTRYYTMPYTPPPVWGKETYHHKDTPYDYYRDMDRSVGKMYFTEPVHRDAREGKSGMSRVKYYESKEMHNTGSLEDKNANMKSLERFLDDVGRDITEMVSDLSAEERSMLRNKMVSIANSVN